MSYLSKRVSTPDSVMGTLRPARMLSSFVTSGLPHKIQAVDPAWQSHVGV
jgi:hypothetical protein